MSRVVNAIINAGSGAIPDQGDDWTNTFDAAVGHAHSWLARIHRDGLTDVELLTGYRYNDAGRWSFDFRHTVTDVIVTLETHGLDNFEAYCRQRGPVPPRVYWNGSSTSEPDLEQFAAPGYRMLKTYVAEDA